MLRDLWVYRSRQELRDRGSHLWKTDRWQRAGKLLQLWLFSLNLSPPVRAVFALKEPSWGSTLLNLP